MYAFRTHVCLSHYKQQPERCKSKAVRSSADTNYLDPTFADRIGRQMPFV